jgi:hypothetical protein
MSVGGILSLTDTTASTSTTTGAMKIAGGLGVVGDIWAANLRATTAVLPDANDGATLGSATVSWSDLFLASGAVINFANGDVTVTHASNALTIAGGNVTVAENLYAASMYLEEDAGSSYYLRLFNNSGLTAGRTLNLNVNNADRTISLAGNLTLANNLTTSTGAVTIEAQSGGSTLNLPTASTISSLTANHVLYASAANTIAGEAQLSISRGGTGLATTSVRYALLGPTSAAGAPTWRAITSADISDATNASTANMVVKRDGSGNFSAGTITAAQSGNATTATTASKVASSLVLKFDTGATPDTDIYTFDGSAAKTIDIKGGTNVTLTKAANVVTISSTYTNYYPTSFAWTGGTAAGPTGSLTVSGTTAVSFAAIPSASASASGIVTNGTQTFAGVKTFNNTTASTSTTTGAVIISGGLGVAKDIWAAKYNNLTLAAAETSFTIAGGTTTSKTLTVSGDATISGGSHSGTNTGNQTITSGNGMNFTTGSGNVTITLGTPSNITSSSTNSVTTTSHTHAIVGEALTKVDDTNVTLTLGGTPATGLVKATSLTLGWKGQLSLARGGSGANLTAAAGGIVYSTSTAMAIKAAGTSGQALLSGGTAAPTWTTGTLTLNKNLTVSTGNVTLTGQAAGSSVTLPASGTLVADSRKVAGMALSSDITLKTLTISSPLSGASYNGSTAVSIGLASGYGDTQNPYASKTAKYFLAAPNGAAGAPTFRAIVASDIPTLNQNTTGSSGSCTGTAAYVAADGVNADQGAVDVEFASVKSKNNTFYYSTVAHTRYNAASKTIDFVFN